MFKFNCAGNAITLRIDSALGLGFFLSIQNMCQEWVFRPIAVASTNTVTLSGASWAEFGSEKTEFEGWLVRCTS